METIGYVILYSLYKHAVEDSQVSDDLRPGLSKEFTEFFPAASILGLLYKRALRFSQDADEWMPYLLAYLRNDAALSICAAATFTFLAHLNKTKKPRNDSVTALEVMVAKEFPTPRGMPFGEVYPLWIGILRKSALAVPVAQGSAT